MKSFLVLVGYNQRFIPGFGTLASPLNDLTRKALPDRVTWSEAAEGAFGNLQQVLFSEPILITPDFSLGEVISQVQAGEEHPVTDISGKHLSNKKN